MNFHNFQIEKAFHSFMNAFLLSVVYQKPSYTLAGKKLREEEDSKYSILRCY